MNFSFHTLEIAGYRDQHIPNTFIRQSDETDHVAIALPGVGYSVHMPLLYYPVRILLDLGADVLRVETMYVKAPGYDALSPAEKAQWIFDDASAACRVALGQRRYRRVTLVGKSLGTMAMGHLLTAEPALANAQALWLTPLLWNAALVQQIEQARPRSFFAVGTADPHYHASSLSALQAATGGTVVVIKGANHSLEIPGDIVQSLHALEQVIRAAKDFLEQT